MYGINYSPLTGRIYVGRLAKGGWSWESKEDVTMPALAAAAECIEAQHGGDVMLTDRSGDGPSWRVTVERIESGDE